MNNLVTLLIILLGGALSLSAQADVTINNISRVSGKTELKVTIANKGKTAASNIKLKIYALPFAFCAGQSPYLPTTNTDNYPCVQKPFEIPLGMRISSLEGAKHKLGLAWTSVVNEPFGAAAGSVTEKIIKFPAHIPPALPGQTKHNVFPVPYFYDPQSHAHLFAPRSILTFDLSVYYAVVEADGELDKTNNEYFFNIRQRG